MTSNEQKQSDLQRLADTIEEMESLLGDCIALSECVNDSGHRMGQFDRIKSILAEASEDTMCNLMHYSNIVETEEKIKTLEKMSTMLREMDTNLLDDGEDVHNNKVENSITYYICHLKSTLE